MPLLLAGCSFAPAYTPPQTAAPATFKEAPQGWASATPRDSESRGLWWQTFGDPQLDALEDRLEKASPSLAAALARYDAALAAARVSQADLFPTLSASASGVRARTSGTRPNAVRPNTYTDFLIGGALDYEIDLWGRVRNSVAASRADAQASDADLANARLSLQAALADAYFQLRGLDAQAALLAQTVSANGRALELTTTRHDGGIASGLDVSRAQSVFSDARAQISDVARQRAVTEHAIAALIGELPSTFSIAPVDALATPPLLPGETPATLLQRRPDIAAAERRMAAANARIGVARAAFFPSISLGLSGGWEATHGPLISTPSSFWGLGPLAAAVDLFDSGRRKARVRMSRADYEEMSADYRGTVLAAFQDAEDAIAATRHLATQFTDADAAATASARTLDLALVRYRDGASDYLDVVTAQTGALAAQRAAITVRTRQWQAAVALVRAMGGNPG